MKDIVDNRIKFLYVILAIAGLLLVSKFALVGIFQKSGFQALFAAQNNIIISEEMPRGEIFDRNGKLLAGNKSEKDLMYIQPKEPYQMSDAYKDEMWRVATRISEIVNIEYNKDLVKPIDVKNMWINYVGTNEALSLLSDSEYQKFESGEISLDKAYELIRAKLTRKDFKPLTDIYSDQAIYVYTLMNSSTTTNSVVVENDITLNEQYAVEKEFGSLGGFYVTTDWSRTYPQGDTLRTFIGSLGLIEEEDINHYLSMGYSYNEEVGRSNVEKEMEETLHGKSSRKKLEFDDDGNIINYDVLNEGHGGNDIVLTIDLDLQKEADKAVKEQTKSVGSNNESVFAVVTNPQTGDLLATSGVLKDDNGKYREYSAGTFLNAYEAGSAVKPALLATALAEGKWDLSTIVNDQPLHIKGTPEKSSYRNYGPVDVKQAMGHSSNVYFWYVALAIAGETYVENQGLDIPKSAFDTVRRGLAEFGLGRNTGISMENESIGYTGSGYEPGFYLDLAIGQYDTYTTMQMNQYMSTIANGSRMKINYITSINEPGPINSPGKVISSFEPKKLNSLSISNTDLNNIRDYLKEPTKSYGTAHMFSNSKYNPRAKTGTAESFYYNQKTHSLSEEINSSFIGYAPADNPEIAVSAMVPYQGNASEGAATICKKIMDYYFGAK